MEIYCKLLFTNIKRKNYINMITQPYTHPAM